MKLKVGFEVFAFAVLVALVAIVPSGPDQEYNGSAMVHFAGIAAARRRVYLTSPYFIPDDATLNALVSAALRRVG